MHEMSLVRDVVDVVTRAARENGIERVGMVNMTIGRGRDVVPQLFDDLFHHLAQGTPAEGARLEVTNTPYMARCRACGFPWHLDTFDHATWVCPGCGARDYGIVSGFEFRIDSIVPAEPADAREEAPQAELAGMCR